MSRQPNPPGACPLPHPIPACTAGGCWHVAPGARPEPTSSLLARWGIGCLPDFTSEEIAAQTVAALRLAEEIIGAGPVQRIAAPERPAFRPWVAEGVREAAPDPERSREERRAEARRRMEAAAEELRALEEI